MDFAYCIDCQELNYAITDSNGVFDRNKAASNHWNHRNIIFGAPDTYVAPIRNVLAKLQAQLPIRDIEMVFFKIAIDLAEDDDIKQWHENCKQKPI